jgi:hypothetical protein
MRWAIKQFEQPRNAFEVVLPEIGLCREIGNVQRHGYWEQRPESDRGGTDLAPDSNISEIVIASRAPFG